MISTKSVTVALGAIVASRNIFLEAINIVFRAPMLFFDQTPVGRNLNRLGKDVDTIDNRLPMILGLWINHFFRV